MYFSVESAAKQDIHVQTCACPTLLLIQMTVLVHMHTTRMIPRNRGGVIATPIKSSYANDEQRATNTIPLPHSLSLSLHILCTMAQQVYLRNYFNRFPDFHYDETKETIDQFKRLSRQQRWSDEERDDERLALRTALVLQFNDSYGEDDKDIQGWQKLCRAIALDHIPESVTECKQVFEVIHVNLVDLVDAQGSQRTVTTFPTERALADYTKANSKFFPRDDAKAGGLLRLLLRQIMHPGERDSRKSNPKKRGPRRR